MRAADYSRRAASPKGMSAKGMLFELQVEQHQHDETYHREIARLSMHQRLNHMALHFAKYTGKIAASANTHDVSKVFVDTLIIALSTANILNTELWKIVEPKQREFLDLASLGRSLAAEINAESGDLQMFLREMAIASGRMAAACEKIDHLEEVPFREEIKHANARLAILSLVFTSTRGIDPVQAVRERLDSVKKRLKLHGRI